MVPSDATESGITCVTWWGIRDLRYLLQLRSSCGTRRQKHEIRPVSRLLVQNGTVMDQTPRSWNRLWVSVLHTVYLLETNLLLRRVLISFILGIGDSNLHKFDGAHYIHGYSRNILNVDENSFICPKVCHSI